MPIPDQHNTPLDPADFVAGAEKIYHQGKCDRAVDLLVAAGEQLPQDGSIRLKLADLLIDSEQYADALNILDRLPAGIAPLEVAARRGRCQANTGDYRSAMRSVEELRVHDTDHPAAMHLEGLIALRTGRLARAEELLQKALALDPDSGEACKDLGQVFKEGGDPLAALDFMEKGFRRAPIARSVALAYHNEVLARSASERAERVFREAVEKHPGNQRLKFLYTDILLRLGKPGKALDVIQDCILRFGPDEGLLDAALQVRRPLDAAARADDQNRGGRISLCMIVKNEEFHLARCLASVQSLVDEIVLVDTGSTDLTLKIGRVFGARIFRQPWQNDFARARNFSLSKATGDWALILDADEVVSGQDLDRLRATVGSSAAGRAYSIVTRNYTHQANLVGWTANRGEYPREEAGSGWYPSPKVRLFPNDPRIRFSYPIHELVEPSLKRLGIEVENCPIPVHHFGKLGGRKNDQKARAYYDLGLKKLESLGDNAVALREMAVQAAGLGKFEAAVELWGRYLALEPESVEAYINMGTACWQVADYQSAARHAEKAICLAPNLKEARFNSALAHLYLGEGDRAVTILEKLIKRHPRYLAARFMLASAYACTGQRDQAQAAFRKIRRHISAFEIQTAVSEVLDRLSRAGMDQYVINLRPFNRPGKSQAAS